MTFVELQAERSRRLIAESDRDRAYRERAQLVAHLAGLYPARIAHSDWDNPEWPVVTVETPAGQMSWHINPADAHFFRHIPGINNAVRDWDGHSTDEKYLRLRHLIDLNLTQQLIDPTSQETDPQP